MDPAERFLDRDRLSQIPLGEPLRRWLLEVVEGKSGRQAEEKR